MATDVKLKSYQDRATEIQDTTRTLLEDLMADTTLPAQSFTEPINRHNMSNQVVNSMNFLESMKQTIQNKFDSKIIEP